MPKATRKQKEAKMLEEMGFERKVVKPMKKKRKMTEEQRAAAAERLAKAREKRMAGKKPANVSEEVLNLPEDHQLGHKNVKEWIAYNKDHLKAIKLYKDSKDAKERSEYLNTQTYIKNLETWLRTGVYLDHRWGKTGNQTVRFKVVARSETTVALDRIGHTDKTYEQIEELMNEQSSS